MKLFQARKWSVQKTDGIYYDFIVRVQRFRIHFIAWLTGFLNLKFCLKMTSPFFLIFVFCFSTRLFFYINFMRFMFNFSKRIPQITSLHVQLNFRTSKQTKSFVLTISMGDHEIGENSKVNINVVFFSRLEITANKTCIISMTILFFFSFLFSSVRVLRHVLYKY